MDKLNYIIDTIRRQLSVPNILSKSTESASATEFKDRSGKWSKWSGEADGRNGPNHSTLEHRLPDSQGRAGARKSEIGRLAGPRELELVQGRKSRLGRGLAMQIVRLAPQNCRHPSPIPLDPLCRRITNSCRNAATNRTSILDLVTLKPNYRCPLRHVPFVDVRTEDCSIPCYLRTVLILYLWSINNFYFREDRIGILEMYNFI